MERILLSSTGLMEGVSPLLLYLKGSPSSLQWGSLYLAGCSRNVEIQGKSVVQWDLSNQVSLIGTDSTLAFIGNYEAKA